MLLAGGNMNARRAQELAEYLSLEIEGDANMELRSVAGPEQAGANDLVYVESAKNLDRVLQSAAKCVLTTPALRVPGKTMIFSERPKLSFAQAAAWLMPEDDAALVHPTAVIAASSILGMEVNVGPYAVIEDGVKIGNGSRIGAFSFIGKGCRIGEKSVLHPRVTLYAGTHLGSRVIVHSGTVLGGDGFGYITDSGRHWKFPQVGGLEIGDDVEIGANSAVDRGSLGTTRLGAQVKLDNLVHVAHNVEIGEGSLIAAQTGIAGSSWIGRGVSVGGQTGIAEHCRLEDGCMAGGQSGIPPGKIIRRGQVVWGTPARELSRYKEQYVWTARLPDLARKLERLEKIAKSAGGSS
jgi:UDP-3-O-[3-hydroxymyristoyl] glucosamine N-acyltransferase